MSSNKIILFDIPAKDSPVPWSLNTWRMRLYLNYKGLDYETKWLEYPEIKPTLKDHVEPNKDEPHYVVPAVVLPDGTYIMGSPKIAEVLNKLHPEPQVILDPHGYTEFIAFVRAVMDALEPVYFTAVPWRLLNEASVPYFESTREKDAGMPLEKFWKERGGDICWTQAEPPLRGVTALLKENQGGPFFLGEAVSIADFVWAGLLIWFRRMGEDDYFQEILKRSGDGQVHLDILKAVEPWCKKID